VSSTGGISDGTSSGGAGSGSAATSSQAGSQGTSVLINCSQADNKGKKGNCFPCNFPADHVGTNCSVELCIYRDSALHKNENCHLLNTPKPSCDVWNL
jgi:hypothetical protein